MGRPFRVGLGCVAPGDKPVLFVVCLTPRVTGGAMVMHLLSYGGKSDVWSDCSLLDPTDRFARL